MSDGLGSCPCGSAPYGSGTPTEGPENAGDLFALAGGGTSGSRFIDYRTGDYELGDDGRPIGMGDTPQLVLLALSKAVKAEGRIGPETEGIIRRRVQAALLHLTSRGLVEIKSIAFSRFGSNGINTRVVWRDLATEQEHVTPLG